MSADLVPFGEWRYDARITKAGRRRDVEVRPRADAEPKSFDQTDIVVRLRRFFDALEAEAHDHEGDPVALSQALARMEALLADVRYARDSLKRLTAEALDEQQVRRLTVEGVCTVEGTTETKRTGWRHAELLTEMLNRCQYALLNTATGEKFSTEEAVATLLSWLTPTWKMTPLKSLSMNPDDFCDVSTDDDGKPVRTPSVRMHNNEIRNQ
jgi:hypothetical protein